MDTTWRFQGSLTLNNEITQEITFIPANTFSLYGGYCFYLYLQLLAYPETAVYFVQLGDDKS